MTKELQPFLQRILASRDLHARWINTFSFLEYIGFRKIVKSQLARHLDVDTLTHMIEEGRHALRLKRLALRIGGELYSTYSPESLLCGEAAEFYFQELDQKCEELLSEHFAPDTLSRLVYLYVTWIVETRALSVYKQYQAEAPQIPLSGLVAEEELHLNSVRRELRDTDPAFESRATQVKVIEEGLYQRFLTALSTLR